MRKCCLLAAVLILALATNVLYAGDGEIRRAGRSLKGSYIVILKDSADAPGAAATAMVNAHGARLKHVYTSALRGFSFEANETVARAISRNPLVEAVEEDPQMTLNVTQSPAPSWGLDRMDQYGLPLNDSYTATYTGTGTAIYVIDSGVNPVSDLAGRIRAARNWAAAPNGVVNPSDTADCFGHGTSVASVAAGTTYGLAKNAKIINLRVLDCNNIFPNGSVVAAAVDWMVSDHVTNFPNEPAAANLSLRTFSGASSAIDTAVMNAVLSGITVVVSSGNSDDNACNASPSRLGNSTSYPTASGSSVITVGASTRMDERAGFSSWGPCVDIHAPGQDVTAMTNGGAISSSLSGTSFAAPHVAGLALQHMNRYNVANNPGMIEGVIKDNGIPNKLTNVPAGTPNLLAWLSVARRRACCS
jgi:subtilisin family serine protease